MTTPIQLGIVMDPIATIKPTKDSTLALLLAATRREWSIFYMTPQDLYLATDIPKAYMRPLTVSDNPQSWFATGNAQKKPLSDLQLILMRLDPPVNAQYLHTTQLLEIAERKGVLIANKPRSLRDYNEKLFALRFSECCPPTLVTHSYTEAINFISRYQDTIIKPLDGMGGESIFRLKQDDPNLHVILETLALRPEGYFLIQQYIPEITQGDKRILMIDGTPVPYALARLPKTGETRANLAAGGTGIAIPLTEHDQWICKQIGPTLREKGLFFVGLDVIGNYLTEINITSPTGIRELEAQTGLNISDQVLDCLQRKILL